MSMARGPRRAGGQMLVQLSIQETRIWPCSSSNITGCCAATTAHGIKLKVDVGQGQDGGDEEVDGAMGWLGMG
jgi:hypothetical protein